MKRGYSDSEDEDFDDDLTEYGDGLDETSYPDRKPMQHIHQDVHRSEDRPVALGEIEPNGPFQWRRPETRRDPLLGLPDGVSPSGMVMDTVFLNLANAVHMRDEATAATYALEAFRAFVYSNKRMLFLPPSSLEPQLLVEEFGGVGPFQSVMAWSIHQRIYTEILGIFVDQVGIADPTALVAITTLWSSYERCLFILPMVSLSKLLAIVNLLCHCRKDSSIPILRDICEDNAAGRAWRAHITSPAGMRGLFTLMSRSDATKSISLFQTQEYYFTTRLRLDMYAKVACSTPHPVYLCQSGAMRPPYVLKYIDGIRRDLLPDEDDSLSVVLLTIEDNLLMLSRHVNNACGRDRWVEIQSSLQILPYLLRNCPVLDSLIEGSRQHVGAAPVCIRHDYARTLWNVDGNTTDALRVVTVDSSVVVAARGRVPVMFDLLRAFTDRPRVMRSDDARSVLGLTVTHATGVVGWRDGIYAQRNALLINQTGFISQLYLVKQNQKKIDTAVAKTKHDALTDIETDGDFFEVDTAVRLSGNVFEVVLTGRAVAVLSLEPSTESSDVSATVTVPEGVAEPLVEVIRRSSHEIRAVVVFNETSSTECTRRLLLHRWPFAMEGGVIGKTYDWVVMVPSVPKPGVVCRRIDVLRDTTRDLKVPQLMSAIARPELMLRLLVKMERTRCLTQTKHHYASFSIDAKGDRTVVVSNINIHCVSWGVSAEKNPDVTSALAKFVEGKARLIAMLENIRRE